MRIFYSWQSDTPPKIGRYLIKDALKFAIKEITADLELEEADRPELDHDTKGILGAPDISQAILEKIDLADIVVTDVTLVGKTPAGKKLINSNVAIELGYALKSKGYEALLVIVNTEYGEDKELPFDLRNRRLSVLYSLSPDANKAEQKKALKRIVGQLKPILTAYLRAKSAIETESTTEFATAETTITPAHYFHESEMLVSENRELGWAGLRCPTNSLIYVRVHPKFAVDGLTERETYQLSQDTAFQPLRIGDGRSRDRNLHGTIIHASNKEKGLIWSATQLFRSKEIWGFDASLLRNSRDREEFKNVIPSKTLKEIIVSPVRRYLDAAERLLKYDPPIMVEVGASNVSGLSIGIDTRFDGPLGPILRKDICKKCELLDYQESTINKCLREVFEEFFDAANSEIPKEFSAFEPRVDW